MTRSRPWADHRLVATLAIAGMLHAPSAEASLSSKLRAAPHRLAALPHLPKKIGEGLLHRAGSLHEPSLIRDSGVIASVGLHGGFIVGGAADTGVAIRPGATAGAHHLVLPFAAAGVSLTPVAIRGVLSPGHSGIERKASVPGVSVGYGDPLFGDRVTLSIPMFSLFASRSGGLGASIDVPLPLPLPPPLIYPLVRGNLSLYVSNPHLAPLSGWILDRADQGKAVAKKWITHVERPIAHALEKDLIRPIEKEVIHPVSARL